jgi:hypothetical protein
MHLTKKDNVASAHSHCSCILFSKHGQSNIIELALQKWIGYREKISSQVSLEGKFKVLFLSIHAFEQ